MARTHTLRAHAGQDRVGFSIVTEADEAVVIDGTPTDEWQASAPMNTVSVLVCWCVLHLTTTTTLTPTHALRLARTTTRLVSSSASTRARRPTAHPRCVILCVCAAYVLLARVRTHSRTHCTRTRAQVTVSQPFLTVQLRGEASTSNIVEFDDYDDYDDGEFQMLEVIYKCLTFGQVSASV
jgi:hypothetical protein